MRYFKNVIFNYVLILSIIFCWQSNANAEGSRREPADIGTLEQIKLDVKYIIETPQGMDKKSYIALGTVLGAAGIMYAEKEDINRQFQKNRTKTTDNIAKYVKSLGDVFVVGGIGATFYSLGSLTESSREKETGLMLAESLIYTGILTGIGQFVFAEDRPYEGGDMHFLKTGGHGISGHAAISASIAGPLNRQYLQIEPDANEIERLTKYTGKLVVYGIPFLVGLSRVNDNEHYAWNVLLGSILGYTMGELVANAHQKAKENNVSFAPFIQDHTKGIMVSFHF
ncbi:MAG: phosphatase PAP2 family protein [Candidatus Omnitrophica bacterium]|nr:phosphatase PAP2 family protein [Candidatus Omnitrophota bacterium]